MTPEQFITRWTANKLTERGGAQAHFDDLCDLLDVDKPRDADLYCFERGAKKSGGGDGWADVWKRGHFGWKNKKSGRDIKAALKQLTDYALELDNPPLLVVSDCERIEIHTAFTRLPRPAAPDSSGRHQPAGKPANPALGLYRSQKAAPHQIARRDNRRSRRQVRPARRSDA